MGGIIVFLLWFIFANLGIIFTYRQVFSVKIAIKVMFFAGIGKVWMFFVVYIKLAPDTSTEGFVKRWLMTKNEFC